MKTFTTLIEDLDSTNKTNDKLSAIQRFFESADDKDKVWCVALFTGRRPRRTVNASLLAEWARQIKDIPGWLFEESYHAVGDLSETIALILPEGKAETELSLADYMELITGLENEDIKVKEATIKDAWSNQDYYERFVFNKLITGNFRIGVSARMLTKALAATTGIDSEDLSHRLSGKWDPFKTSWNDLLRADVASDESKPYPFYLAYPLDDLSIISDPAEWAAEWKWDGIRGQLIIRNGNVYLWSRGEELVNDQFPEIVEAAKKIEGNLVLDGEILPFKEGKPMPFAALQKRLGRKKVSKALLSEVPAAFYVYDILEHQGEDLRSRKYEERRKLLLSVLEGRPDGIIIPAPDIPFSSMEELKGWRERSRDHSSEGLMLKRKSSSYLAGRKRGDWWKWKIDPLTIDAVLIYAQPGSGRRAGLYTDYTFGIWKGEELVPVAKAYSGLTDLEITQVDKFIRANTLEKFGPVRSVKPELVFELGFEAISRSNRHKSGIAVRFPRILRWRMDKPAAEADSMESVTALLEKYGL